MERVSKIITEHLSQGWELYGNVTVTDCEGFYFTQAMIKKTKKKAETKTPIPLDKLMNHDDEMAFNIFWEAGLRKLNKKKAFTDFLKQYRNYEIGTMEEFAEMLANDIKFRLKYGQFGFESMHPTTYLRGMRWNDEKIKGDQDAKSSGNSKASTTDIFEQAAQELYYEGGNS